jgi:hypothetical protein
VLLCWPLHRAGTFWHVNFEPVSMLAGIIGALYIATRVLVLLTNVMLSLHADAFFLVPRLLQLPQANL